tara:strand:- start:216 stop:371 length:156 start_codon:yes stop_codon:yes gene_type:complete
VPEASSAAALKEVATSVLKAVEKVDEEEETMMKVVVLVVASSEERRNFRRY